MNNFEYTRNSFTSLIEFFSFSATGYGIFRNKGYNPLTPPCIDFITLIHTVVKGGEQSLTL